jgi:protease I
MNGMLCTRTIAILATHGYEQSALLEPKKALELEGAKTEVVSLEAGTIRGWKLKNWGQEIPVDLPIKMAQAARYDGLLLPGGVLSTDRLRAEPLAVQFVREFFHQDKPVAAICHAPWLLIEAGVVRGRRLTSWPSLRSDVRNAGGEWLDQDVVVYGRLVTGRRAENLSAFSNQLLAVLERTQSPKVEIGAADIS